MHQDLSRHRCMCPSGRALNEIGGGGGDKNIIRSSEITTSNVILNQRRHFVSLGVLFVFI